MGFSSVLLVKRSSRWVKSCGKQLAHVRCYAALTSIYCSDAPRLIEQRLSSNPRTTVWVRGAKRKTILNLEDLPQGTLPLDPLPSEIAPTYPTVIQQARSNMDKFPHCVVLTRVGGFYEVSRYPLTEIQLALLTFLSALL